MSLQAGKRLLELRLARGWKREELARRCGLSSRTIKRRELGAAASEKTIRALARALEVPVGELVGEGEEIPAALPPVEEWRESMLAHLAQEGALDTGELRDALELVYKIVKRQKSSQ